MLINFANNKMASLLCLKNKILKKLTFLKLQTNSAYGDFLGRPVF